MDFSYLSLGDAMMNAMSVVSTPIANPTQKITTSLLPGILGAASGASAARGCIG